MLRSSDLTFKGIKHVTVLKMMSFVSPELLALKYWFSIKPNIKKGNKSFSGPVPLCVNYLLFNINHLFNRWIFSACDFVVINTPHFDLIITDLKRLESLFKVVGLAHPDLTRHIYYFKCYMLLFRKIRLFLWSNSNIDLDSNKIKNANDVLKLLRDNLDLWERESASNDR